MPKSTIFWDILNIFVDFGASILPIGYLRRTGIIRPLRKRASGMNNTKCQTMRFGFVSDYF